MLRFSLLTKVLVLILFLGNFAIGQEESVPDRLKDQVGEIGEQIGEIGKTLDDVEAVKEASAGILQPIYDMADVVSIPSFYWVAFALMVAGVVSFACQLVFSKLLLLFRLHLNIKEILSDILGLIISLIGLILTTQAATQNSTFPDSPVMVVSAAFAGIILGFVFYWWGQSTEFKAAKKPVEVAKQ